MDICCLLGICCPPGSPEQLDAFEKTLATMEGMDEAKAKKIAAKMATELATFTRKLAKLAKA